MFAIITPDHQYIIKVTGQHDDAVALINARTTELIRQQSLKQCYQVKSLAVIDNEHFLISTRDGYLQSNSLEVWNMRSFSKVCGVSDAYGCKVSRDKETIVYSTYPPAIHVWHWKTGSYKTLWKTPCGYPFPNFRVYDIASDKRYIIGTKTLYQGDDRHPIEKTLELWDLATGKVIVQVPEYIQAMALPNPEFILAVERKSGRLAVVNIETLRSLTVLDPPVATDKWGCELGVSYDGKFAVASLAYTSGSVPGSYDAQRTLGVWDVAQGKLAYSLDWRSLAFCEFSMDNRYLYSFSAWKKLELCSGFIDAISHY